MHNVSLGEIASRSFPIVDDRAEGSDEYPGKDAAGFQALSATLTWLAKTARPPDDELQYQWEQSLRRGGHTSGISCGPAQDHVGAYTIRGHN